MMKSEMMNEVITSTIDSTTELLNKICFGEVFIYNRPFNLPPNNFRHVTVGHVGKCPTHKFSIGRIFGTLWISCSLWFSAYYLLLA